MKNYNDHPAFARASVTIVTHPKKPGKYAKILTAHPKDGAGRLTVFIHDFFGDCGSEVQTGSATGYGYDKTTAAMRGMVIDGHELGDHSGVDKSCARQIKTQKAKPGYSLCNWSTPEGRYTSCYKLAGLDYLRAIGYTVICAL